MTPDPAAVAALRVMACPWSLGIDGEVPAGRSCCDGERRGRNYTREVCLRH